MALPVSGKISFSQINTELGLLANSKRNLAQATTRTLFGVSTGKILMSNGRGKANQFAFTIASNHKYANLRELALDAGWNESVKVIATVAADVYLYSDNNTKAALTINGSFPNGVELVNNGFIMGAGGAGGGFLLAGDPGGTAISLGVNATITNNNVLACIAGGGGGGGGGAYSGGGGGAGGGSGGHPQDWPAGYAGAGGLGGGPGLPGSNGTTGYFGIYNNVAGGGGGGGRVGKVVNAGGFVFNIASALGGAGGGSLISNAGGKGGQAGGGGGGSDYPASGGPGGNSNAGGANGAYPSAGGGAGWGAVGGSAPFGSVPGGTGGKAIALNGFTATVNAPVGVIYGIVS